MNLDYSGRRVLITGGVGFIGSNLAIRLAEMGAKVLLVDSMIPSYGARLENVEAVRDRIRINYSDVRDARSLSYLVQDEEIIFSLAGQVSHRESMDDPMTDLEINCASQLSLLECCRRHNPQARIVFASTRQLYGRPQKLPVDESHPLEPVDVNGINKLAAERYYTLYHQVYQIPTVSLRLTNTYGPRMDLENRQKGFAGVFIRQALDGERIRLFGGGSQLRDFNYVDDVVDALLLAGQHDKVVGEVCNLGHKTPHSLHEFVQLLSRNTSFDTESVPFPDEIKSIDIGDYYGDYSRFNRLTGWEPKVDLAEGLERTLRWFQAQRES